MRRTAALPTVIATLIALACLAAPAAGTDGEPPCLADIKRLCNRVPPTGSFVQGCLQAHERELSAGCRKHVGNVTRDSVALNAACQRDIAKHCANQPLEAGRAESCLIAHRDQLSTTCADILNEQSQE